MIEGELSHLNVGLVSNKTRLRYGRPAVNAIYKRPFTIISPDSARGSTGHELGTSRRDFVLSANERRVRAPSGGRCVRMRSSHPYRDRQQATQRHQSPHSPITEQSAQPL